MLHRRVRHAPGVPAARARRDRRLRHARRLVHAAPEEPLLTAAGDAGASPCVNSIFQQPWWLDALAPGRWDAATVESDDGRTVARMPYVVRGRGRVRMLTQPPLTQTLGPWVAPSDAKPANALAEEMELLTALEAALPEAVAFDQQFSPAMTNALPFHWAGYRLEVQYTYRLDARRSEEDLWDGLRSNIRREIRKARKRVEVRDDLGLDRFHDVWGKTFTRQGLEAPQPLGLLARLDAACAARDARRMLFAVDEAGEVHAAAYVVWDERAAYYLMGGGDPALRNSGAGSLVMWEAITRARERAPVFDFEGSMLQPVERFFRSFGSHQTPYLHVSRTSPAARAGLALRAAGKRLRRRPASPWP